jgi:DNA transformation protein and related proteins
MADDLTILPNIGKELACKLKQIGINSPEELKAAGTEQVFIQLKIIDPGACFSELCAIEGAIADIRWHYLSSVRKQELKQFFAITQTIK